MSQGIPQSDCPNLSQTADKESLQPSVASLGIDAFGCRGAFLVNLFRRLGRHSTSPFRDGWTIIVARFMSVTIGVFRLHHGSVNRRAALRRTYFINGFLFHESTIDEDLLRTLPVSLLMLFDHGRHLPLIAARIRDRYTRNHLRAGVCGHLHVVGWAKTAVAHFHGPCIRIGSRCTRLFSVFRFLAGFDPRQMLDCSTNPLG